MTHETFVHLETALKWRNKTVAGLKKRFSLSKQVISNWRRRGVPASRMLAISQWVPCSPRFIEEGTGPMGDVHETPLREAGHMPLNADALFIARGYMTASRDMKRAFLAAVEDFVRHLSEAEQAEFRAVLDRDIAAYTGSKKRASW